MSRFASVIRSFKRPVVLGMVHVQALPGTPLNSLRIDQIVDRAKRDADIYNRYGLDGVIIENMHDVPYLNSTIRLGPETISCMTPICSEVKRMSSFSMYGVQVLSSRNEEAMAIALAAEYNFIRAEGFVFGHIGDEGFIDSCAGSLLRYRKTIGAHGVAVLTDIKKKHSSHEITADVTLEETAEAAAFFLSDGLIITGSATGQPTSTGDLRKLKNNPKIDLPVIIGSGINHSNMNQYKDADAWIVGSTFKQNGSWREDVDEERVNQFMNAFKEL